MARIIFIAYLIANFWYFFIREKRDIHVFFAIQIIGAGLLLG